LKHAGACELRDPGRHGHWLLCGSSQDAQPVQQHQRQPIHGAAGELQQWRAGVGFHELPLHDRNHDHGELNGLD
ncbi:hypothetical protein EG878_17130, partial [Enterococcus faecalis]